MSRQAIGIVMAVVLLMGAVALWLANKNGSAPTPTTAPAESRLPSPVSRPLSTEPGTRNPEPVSTAPAPPTTQATVTVTLAPITGDLSAALWPSFRGNPAFTGLAAGTISDQLELKWKFTTGGPINSSPVIAEGHVFIGSDDGNVYALDLKTGAKVWAFAPSHAADEEPGAFGAPPLYLAGTIYIGCTDRNLYALDSRSGRLKWAYQTGDKILGSANWVAVQPSSLPSDAAGMAAPQGSIRILVGSYDTSMHCVDAAAGKEIWTYQTGNWINGDSAIAAGQVVFGGCDATLHVIDAATGKSKAEVPVEEPIAGSAALSDGFAYFGHYGNAFLCVDLAKAEVKWTYKDRNSPYFSCPAVAGKTVVFGGRDKRVHAADRITGAELWTFQTHGQVDSSPVICADKVAVGSADGKIYLLDLATGKELWSYEIGDGISGAPAVAAGLIVVGAEDGTVYAFGPRP